MSFMLTVAIKPIMLSVMMLSVVMLSFVMLSVAMLTVIMLSVVMLSVVATSFPPSSNVCELGWNHGQTSANRAKPGPSFQL